MFHPRRTGKTSIVLWYDLKSHLFSTEHAWLPFARKHYSSLSQRIATRARARVHMIPGIPLTSHPSHKIKTSIISTIKQKCLLSTEHGHPSQENKIHHHLNEFPPEPELCPNDTSPITIHDFPERQTPCHSDSIPVTKYKFIGTTKKI